MNQSELFGDSIIFPASGKRSDVNPQEAPPGYYAIPKSEAKAETKGANICSACDWRRSCNGIDYRCMSHPVVTNDGRELQREDECSVVFKKDRQQAEGGRVSR